MTILPYIAARHIRPLRSYFIYRCGKLTFRSGIAVDTLRNLLAVLFDL